MVCLRRCHIDNQPCVTSPEASSYACLSTCMCCRSIERYKSCLKRCQPLCQCRAGGKVRRVFGCSCFWVQCCCCVAASAVGYTETWRVQLHLNGEGAAVDILQSIHQAVNDNHSRCINISVPLSLPATDPTAPEVLQADRLVAAAARKAVAMHRAFEATKQLQALPVSLGQDAVEQKAETA